MLRKLLYVAFVAAGLYNGLVYANNFDDSESGFYIGVGVGAADINPLPNAGFALEGNVGYNFNNYLSVELQANGMPSTQWQNNLLNTYNVFNVAVKGMLPLTDFFSLYGKLGAGLGFSNWSGDGLLEYDEETDEFYYDCAAGDYACTGRARAAVGLGTIGANFKLTRDLSLFVENNNFVPMGGSTGRFGYTFNGVIGLQYTFHNHSPSASYQSQPLINCEDNPHQDGCRVIIELTTMSKTEQEYYQKRIISLKDGSQYIIVLDGDTLSKISIVYNESEDKLKELNKLKSDRIIVGQRLYISKVR